VKRIVAWVLVVAALLLVGIAHADRRLTLMNSSARVPLRMYVGATAQQFDTMAVGSNQRVELDQFQVYADDSAQTTSTLSIAFMSLNSRTIYARLSESYTVANGVKTSNWDGPWVFPYDSTILVYYFMQGTTPATLDTLRVHAVYRLENKN
jgi:hypothetical protein